MDSENVFDLYSAPEAPVAPPSRKKTSKRHPGESSKMPQAKKPCTAGVPEDGPSETATPPPSPHEEQTPPTPVGSSPSPTAPTDQTQLVGPATTGGNITGRAFTSVKDRVAKIVKHDRYREAMAATETMDVDQNLTRALNEFASAFLTLTAGRLRSGTITEQSRSLEQQHADELKAAEAKYSEQLTTMLKEKNKLAEELKEKKNSLDKAIEQRDQFKYSNRINYRETKKNARNAELARCAARMAEEERARIPASPEISLATGMDKGEVDAEEVILYIWCHPPIRHLDYQSGLCCLDAWYIFA
ncbi:uncharacterized protein LOC133799586 [Humulus lupulus]|uniref:uncharacterized protein LOC133799586 n=1 Tax=Humulus lupulus TaxID=3486 RepID=UPI002B40F6B2|nr:uncharacterized protein LOC133799586 [Humulus lupulus]